MPVYADESPHPDGGLRTKRAETAERRAALRHEAALLRMARHPGVAELIRITDEDGTTELTTRSGSDHTLADWDGPDGDAVDTAVIAGVLAALATTCADLHDLGIVHGRIEPQRIALHANGQPVLGDFDGAGPIGSMALPIDPPLPPFCDPAAGPGRPLLPAVDVFGLGALLEHLLERHPSSGADPCRGARRRLRRLARSATAEAHERRPDAADLAKAILDAAPAAHLPGSTIPPVPRPRTPGSAPLRLERPPADPRRPTTDRRIRQVIGATVIALALVGGLLALAHHRPTASREAAGVSKPVTTTPGTTIPSTAEPPSTRPPTTASASTVAEDGPVPSTTPRSATTTDTAPAAESTIVVFEGVRYRLDGGPRRFAVGDWNCDGRATLATLDPTTGAVTFFTTWPRTGSVRATSADRAPGAIDLRADPVGACHRLTIVHADGVETFGGTGVPS